MTQDDLTFFKKWFSDYCRSFYSADIEDQKNIALKEEHTSRVCENIIRITQGLSLKENQTMLAETIALFHDVGRFPQYAQYKTFRDSISVNHGLLGAQILAEHKVLKNLSEHEQEIIIQSVKFHNAFSIPKKEREEIIYFIRLIRDADKLDIWRVFMEFYESPGESRASAVGLGLADLPEYSQDVLSSIHRKEIVSLAKVKNLNDFRLLQLSWIFDLNFKPTFRFLLERNYVDRIAACLPQVEEIHTVSRSLKEFIHQQLQDN
jgi:hypothetical protein